MFLLIKRHCFIFLGNMNIFFSINSPFRLKRQPLTRHFRRSVNSTNWPARYGKLFTIMRETTRVCELRMTAIGAARFEMPFERRPTGSMVVNLCNTRLAILRSAAWAKELGLN